MRATRSLSPRFIRTLAAAAFAGTLAAAVPAIAGPSLQLIADGVPAANTAAPPATAAFAAWCAGRCFPTTQFPVYDPGNRQPKGIAHVWGRDFVFSAGGSLCFSEFITFALAQGELYIASGPNGTCGAPIDPALKPPRYVELGATVVIAGGGDGAIVGGTGSYAGWNGTFSDRVFVGFGAPTSGVGGIVYYDQLWFGINRK